MVKYICIKDYFSKNLPDLKIHSVGAIYNVEFDEVFKICRLYSNDGYNSFNAKELNEYFITLAEYRDKQIEDIIYG